MSTTTTTTTSVIPQPPPAPAAATAEAPVKSRPVNTVPRILEVPTIRAWICSEKLMLEADTVATLNKYFAEKVDWTILLAFAAPENTPDAGTVFTTIKQLCTERGITQAPAEMRKVARAISFIVWQSLVLCRDILAKLDRKKVGHDMLGMLVVSTVSTVAASVGKFRPAEPPAAEEEVMDRAQQPKAKRQRKDSSSEDKPAKKPKKPVGAQVTMAGDPTAVPAAVPEAAVAVAAAVAATPAAPAEPPVKDDDDQEAAEKEKAAAAARALEEN